MKRVLPGAAAAALAVLCGCVPPSPPPASESAPDAALVPTTYSAMPGWTEDDAAAALPGLLAACHRLALMPPDTALGGTGLSRAYGGKAGQWAPACKAAAFTAPTSTAMRDFVATWFQPYRIGATPLVTGYYEPQARGAWQQGGIYQTPVLPRPADLQETPPPASDPNGRPRMSRRAGGTLMPYWTRQEIEAGRAAARPILWLADPVDLFFLQIQGAGRVVLPDAHVVRLAFAGSNGRAYTPIGRILMDRHALAPASVTMQTIRAWLAAHPSEARAVMDGNDHYVFFRLDEDAGARTGPPGALGVDLVPGRAAAVDRHFTPLASLLFLDTTDPLTRAPWRHLVLAHDLGTDIAGPGRVDVFMGAGDPAALRAGQMHESGAIYLLLPRPQSNQRSARGLQSADRFSDD